MRHILGIFVVHKPFLLQHLWWHMNAVNLKKYEETCSQNSLFSLQNLSPAAVVTGFGSSVVQLWAGRRGWPGHLWCQPWRFPSWLSLSSAPGSPASRSLCQESSFPLKVRKKNTHQLNCNDYLLV